MWDKFIRFDLGAMMLFIVLLTLTACATTPRQMSITANVDSIAAADGQRKQHFVILPGNKDVNEQDLQFIEFKTYAERALHNRGFVKAASLQEGDVVVFLSYGVGSPEIHQYAYDVPVWGDVGYYPYYRRFRRYPGFGGYMAMQGVTGYEQRIESYTAYKRYLLLDAYDMAPYLQQQKLVQLWKTTVESQGASNDLRLVFPYLVAALQLYIGTNTGHMLTINVDEFNPLVKELFSINPGGSPFTPPQQ